MCRLNKREIEQDIPRIKSQCFYVFTLLWYCFCL